MRKTDSNRLLKALSISLIFHIFIFFGMNFFDWFPETDSKNKYSPLTVKIESNPVIESLNNKADVSDIQAESSSSEVSVAVPESVPLTEVETKTYKSSSVPVVPPKVKIDPYADLGMNNNSSTFFSEPEPIEKGVQKTSYIPTGQNIIELENAVSEDNNNSQFLEAEGDFSEDSITSVLSDDELLGLEQAINRENEQGPSDSIIQLKSGRDMFEYSDVPVEFDSPGVKRELLTNPPPGIPDDLPSDFPSEIIYTIRFSLNSDGVIQVLSLTPSSVYPKIDASIRKALRSWTFTESSGSEDVAGTITLIFKGK